MANTLLSTAHTPDTHCKGFTESSSSLANGHFKCLSQTKFLIPTSTNVLHPQLSHLSEWLLVPSCCFGSVWGSSLMVPLVLGHCGHPGQREDILRGHSCPPFYCQTAGTRVPNELEFAPGISRWEKKKARCHLQKSLLEREFTRY